MTLQRRPRRGNLLEPETVPALEQILHELKSLSDQQSELKGQVRDLRTLLMGSGDGLETPDGRLVRMGDRITALERDMDSLRNMKVAASAYWNAGRVLGHLVTGLGGGVVATLASHFLLR